MTMTGLGGAPILVGDAAMPTVLGKIAAPHGIRGWVKVVSYTRPTEQILEHGNWLLGGEQKQTDRHAGADWQTIAVAAVRRQSQKLFARLQGVDDRNAAEALTGRWIAVPPTSSPGASKPAGGYSDEYYWSDLTGLKVVNQDGVELGVVDHLIETGANDVLALRQAGETGAEKKPGAEEKLLPWSPDVIVAVDVAARRMRVNWQPDYW